VAKVRPFGAHGLRLRLKPPPDRGGEPLDLVLVHGGAAPRLFGAPVETAGASGAAEAAPASEPEAGPSPFARQARARLEGARLRAIRQPPGERVVFLDLEHRGPDMPGGGEALTLAVELTGRGANAALVGADGRAIAVARPSPHPGRLPGGEGKPRRQLAVGEPYAPPAQLAGGPAGAPPIGARPPLFPDVAPEAATLAYGGRLAAWGAALEAAAGAAEARAALVSDLDRRVKKLEGARRKLEEAVAAGADAERWQRLGHLLLANLHRLRRGMASIEVRDDYAGLAAPPATIDLDPALPPPRQAERLFKRAKKLRRGVEVAGERLLAVAADLERVERARAALAAGATVEEARALAGGGPRSVRPPGRRRGPAGGPGAEARAEPSGPRRFLSRDGLEILVGRSNAENDRLTTRLAKGNDFFFHVEGFAGSHVIVRARAGKSVPLETMLDAAALAVHYSKARDHAKASVSYTPRKYVRKPKGAPAGLVSLDRHQTLFIRPDEERLRRVLATAGGAAEAEDEPGAPPERPS